MSASRLDLCAVDAQPAPGSSHLTATVPDSLARSWMIPQ